MELFHFSTVLGALILVTQTAAELQCDGKVSPELIAEIKGYQDVATKIIQAATSGSFKGRTYNNLAALTDKFGSRPTGSEALEKSLDYAMERMKSDGLENVNAEEVNVDNWIREQESGTLLKPRVKELGVVSLGNAEPTPPEGITAPIVVVKTWDELKARAADVAGKIVVFNQEYGSDYFATVAYRKMGAIEVAKLGGVAALVRSITPFSINSPHTGYLKYDKDVKKIPAGAITVEDAQLLSRMYDRGEELTMKLVLRSHFVTDKQAKSRNVWGELVGKEKKDKLVIVACHIDSWDVGEGVMDDAAGCQVALETANLLKSLNLTPRRTLRSILFTAEEPGLVGVDQYVAKHEGELGNVNVILESDLGTFRPQGVQFTGTDDGACIVQEVMRLLRELNATSVEKGDAIGDAPSFAKKGVPALSLTTDPYKYMFFHHTGGDTMTVENPEELDMCTAVWAVVSYVLADLSVDLPRSS